MLWSCAAPPPPLPDSNTIYRCLSVHLASPPDNSKCHLVWPSRITTTLSTRQQYPAVWSLTLESHVLR
ncbi:hypothetical protein E2C01_075026 [Portunus trituberculatus]|uniref:Uncharacterized protein n=1 Tax=Portunus trituberculatus TaxID=210409 RepID=A0A5B7IEQ3_PORTR|nr:hypothetical protein [Portunus trituberculatus]